MAFDYNFQPAFDVEDRSMGSSFTAKAAIPAKAKISGLPYTHFALIYIDSGGKICLQVSESIANNWQEIISTKVIDAFLRVVSMSKNTYSAKYQVSSNQAPTVMAKIPHLSRINDAPHVGTSFESEEHLQKPLLVATSFQPLVCPIYKQPWPSLLSEDSSHHCEEFCNENFNVIGDKKAMISVEDRPFLALYYSKVFENLQQTNCRILAKAYIKLVEPRKQVIYPYNGRKIVAGTPRQFDPNVTKPPWWPSGVSHREPDHLPKVERIQLLVHILRELRISHGISVAKLQGAEQRVRHQISPPGQLQVLDELYQVMQREERFLEGKSDGQNIAWICRANHPKPAGRDARYTDGSGNNSPSTTATFRDTPTFRGSRRYASTMDAPGGEFFGSSSLGQQVYTSQITNMKPEGLILAHKPSLDSVVPVSPCLLKRKRDFVEIHPVNPRSLTSFSHKALATPSGSQPFSINREYGTPYHLLFPELPITGPSINGLLKETMNGCDTPYCGYFV